MNLLRPEGRGIVKALHYLRGGSFRKEIYHMGGSTTKFFLVLLTQTALKGGVLDPYSGIKTFGVLETERFITSIKSNNFDYIKWHKELWNDKTIDEIHKMAVEFENKKYNKS
jgi:hypothetical protein